MQYPQAKDWFRSDIRSLSQMARLIKWLDGAAAEGDLESLLEEFSKQFLMEFDYEAEQRNMMEIGAALRAVPRFQRRVIVPEVIPTHCSSRVITMNYLPGPTLEQKASALLSRAGIDLRRVCSFIPYREHAC